MVHIYGSTTTTGKRNRTQFKIEQPRATASAANDNDENTDHYGIAEFIVWNEKVSELVFVPTAGAISKPAVDSCLYYSGEMVLATYVLSRMF